MTCKVYIMTSTDLILELTGGWGGAPVNSRIVYLRHCRPLSLSDSKGDFFQIIIIIIIIRSFSIVNYWLVDDKETQMFFGWLILRWWANPPTLPTSSWDPNIQPEAWHHGQVHQMRTNLQEGFFVALKNRETNNIWEAFWKSPGPRDGCFRVFNFEPL